ncbi:Uncharacterised protein [uncultured archaeon]|nr:Uncharacterised protein [uncultured archaeon]
MTFWAVVAIANGTRTQTDAVRAEGLQFSTQNGILYPAKAKRRSEQLFAQFMPHALDAFSSTFTWKPASTEPDGTATSTPFESGGTESRLKFAEFPPARASRLELSLR